MGETRGEGNDDCGGKEVIEGTNSYVDKWDSDGCGV